MLEFSDRLVWALPAPKICSSLSLLQFFVVFMRGCQLVHAPHRNGFCFDVLLCTCFAFLAHRSCCLLLPFSAWATRHSSLAATVWMCRACNRATLTVYTQHNVVEDPNPCGWLPRVASHGIEQYTVTEICWKAFSRKFKWNPKSRQPMNCTLPCFTGVTLIVPWQRDVHNLSEPQHEQTTKFKTTKVKEVNAPEWASKSTDPRNSNSLWTLTAPVSSHLHARRLSHRRLKVATGMHACIGRMRRVPSRSKAKPYMCTIMTNTTHALCSTFQPPALGYFTCTEKNHSRFLYFGWLGRETMYGNASALTTVVRTVRHNRQELRFETQTWIVTFNTGNPHCVRLHRAHARRRVLDGFVCWHESFGQSNTGILRRLPTPLNWCTVQHDSSWSKPNSILSPWQRRIGPFVVFVPSLTCV